MCNVAHKLLDKANFDKAIFWTTEPVWHDANPLCIFIGKMHLSPNLHYHSQSVEQNNPPNFPLAELSLTSF